MSFQTRTIVLTALLTLALGQSSLAQYGGGMGPMGTTPPPGTPGYVAPSHGYKANPALIGGLVGGGAAAGAGLFYYKRHHNVYQGCVGPDGKQFQLQNLAFALTPGEKFSLKAKKVDDGSGSTLEVQDIKKDLGRCERETAARK